MKSLPILLAIPLLASACERSPAPPAASTRPADRAVEHLKVAGEELKQAATEAAREAKPALERAATEARDLARRAGEKISAATSQPATLSAPRP